MVMGKTKRTLFLFSHLDYKAMEEYFTQMAARGWMLERIELITALFKKTEPRRLKFSVDIFPYISAFDSHDNKKVLEYRQLCEESGWKFVTSSNKFQVFCAEAHQDPTPMQTDSVVEEKIVRQSVFSSEFIIFLFCLPLLFLSLGPLFPFEYSRLFTNSGIASTVLIPLLIIPVLMYTGHFILWMWKAKRNIKKGLSLPQISLRSARLRANLLTYTGGIIISLFLIAIIADAVGGHTFTLYFLILPVSVVAITLWFRNKVLSKLRSRAKNIAIFAGFVIGIALLTQVFTAGLISSLDGGLLERAMGFQSELPEEYAALKLTDFGHQEEPQIQAFSRSSSFIVPLNYQYHEVSDEGSIRTKYYQAINSSIASYIFQGMLEREGSLLYRSVSEAPAGDWNADRAYYLNDEQTMLLLLKDKNVIHLDGSFDFSLPEVIAVCKSGFSLSR